MTARLILICHAPTAATRAARFPCPDDGIDASALPRLPVGGARRLVAPERRTRETAAALGFSGTIADALRDGDCGRWAGRPLAEVAAAEPNGLAAWVADPSAAPHGGESLADLARRVEAWMAERAAAGGRTLAVTHPAVVRTAAVAALGAEAASFWRIEAPPLARAVLAHDGRRWTLAGLLPPPRPGRPQDRRRRAAGDHTGR